ncbi:probable peptidoglycan muropeptide transporter SLC46 [Diabrotica undecimpunctata]|uniref:probable peptidoglycan muropeptide transporter SLC46 n=1 Tax=Diabrotica undecimpunctata TaxID=50387 RepID=UPI003B63A933
MAPKIFSNYKVTAEFPLLLVYFAFMLYAGVVTNLMSFKTCYTLLHYPKENCSRLGLETDDATIELEKKVQSQSTYVLTITEMVPSSLPILISLGIGAWSDKHGRRPAMIYTLTCISIGFALYVVILLFDELNPYYMMLGAIPAMVCGGPLTFFSIAISLMNDVATEENRGVTMAVFEVIMVFCMCFGTLSSTPLLYATSYAAVGGVCAGLIIIATIYTYFWVPESLKVDNKNKATFSNVFTCKNLTELFVVAGTKRPNNKRYILLTWLTILFLLNVVATGDGNVKTMYLRNVFEWSMTDKNVFTSWSSVVGMCGTISLMFILYKKLKIKEAPLVILGFVSAIGSSLVYALAKANWHIYTTVFIGICGGIINPMIRTSIAKILPREEMGKIFSLITVVNSLLQVVGGLAYSFIYTKTKSGIFNYVSIGLDVVAITLVLSIMFVSNRSNEPESVSAKDEAQKKQTDLESGDEKTDQELI